jgi:PQQ-dependent catabolism-associated CXXCW motif protein
MKTQRRVFLLFSAVALSLIGQIAPSFADKRIALVIGDGAYQHTATLANPPNDAKDIAEALKAIGFDVTLKVDIEKRQMDQAIAQFARDGKTADVVLFYYAGHGMQFEGKNFLMPIDAELQDELSLRYEMTALDDVKEALRLSPGVKIMVLDACRNNPLAENFGRSIIRSARDIPNVRGFAPLESGQGMIIVYATQANAVADDGGGRNSPFSQAFLKEVKEPGLEVGTMFRRIEGDVYKATKGQQSPELSISMVPEYYLNRSETDQAVWARVRDALDAGSLRDFLDRFPNSPFASEARARVDQLERDAREKADREDAARQQRQKELDAARQQEDQAKSDREAAEAKAREDDLAQKLAAAEAERQRLAKELAQRTADQAEQAKKDREAAEAKAREDDLAQKLAAAEAERQRLAQELTQRTADQAAVQAKRATSPAGDQAAAIASLQAGLQRWQKQADQEGKSMFGDPYQTDTDEPPAKPSTPADGDKSSAANENMRRLMADFFKKNPQLAQQFGAVAGAQNAEDEANAKSAKAFAAITAGEPQTPVDSAQQPFPTHQAPALQQQASAANYAQESTDFGVSPQNALQSNLGTRTPTQIPGARVVTTTALHEAIQQRQRFLLVDAWDDNQHASLPGAVHIPYAGSFGSFNDKTQRALRLELTRLTGGARDYPIVFYCAGSICWESYNAALRAVAMGFSQVYWYRGGVAAWKAAGLN